MCINHQTGTTAIQSIYYKTDPCFLFLVDNYQVQVIFRIVFKNCKNAQNFVNLAMQAMRVYNGNNKIYGIILATISINSGSNVDFSIIETDYDGNILWCDIYYAFNDFNLEY